MPSEKGVARSSREDDAMRMIPARFIREIQRRTRGIDMHFLLIFQELGPISKTCNQLIDIMYSIFRP